jgi:hypothetical protein
MEGRKEGREGGGTVPRSTVVHRGVEVQGHRLARNVDDKVVLERVQNLPFAGKKKNSRA